MPDRRAAHAARAIGTWREARPSPTRRLNLVAAVALADFFGFNAFWIVAGYRRFDEIQLAGLIAAYLPICVFGILGLIGPRGPFSGLWRPRILVTIDPERVGWMAAGSTEPQESAAWSDVATIRFRAFNRRRDERDVEFVSFRADAAS